jgi:hypothetical protein
LSTLAKHRRLGVRALAVSAGLGLAVAVGPAAAARQSACAAGYSYAGLQSSVAVAGIEATVTAMTSPQVAWGHIGGWVGVGGPGMGPNGTDAWIQVGLSSFANHRASRIYYEIRTSRMGLRRCTRTRRVSRVPARTAPMASELR